MADSPVSRVRQRLAFVNLSGNQYLMATAFENVEKSQTGATMYYASKLRTHLKMQYLRPSCTADSPAS